MAELDLSVKPETYWANREPPRTEGDDKADELYHMVGVALSSWENVEETCVNLLIAFTEIQPLVEREGNVFRGRQHEIIFRAFGAGQSGSFRREAILHAGSAHFGVGPHASKHLTYLRKVVRHVQEASQRRDEIAHGRVLAPKGWLLLPPRYNTKLTKVQNPDLKGYEGANYRHIAKDIQDFGEKFNGLSHALDKYRQRVWSGEFQPPQP